MRNYNDPQYKAFRAAVRRRDKYKCQYPGCECKSKLKVHHIRRWSDAPLLRFNADNGITLCRTHHDRITGNEDLYIRVFAQIVARNKNGKKT
jgi:5-methylcytosine-specific restriction endonuclease McrA